MRNTLHYGDCLNVMAEMPDAFVDLIYLDPPFNSKSDYNIFFPNPEMSGGGGGVGGTSPRSSPSTTRGHGMGRHGSAWIG